MWAGSVDVGWFSGCGRVQRLWERFHWVACGRIQWMWEDSVDVRGIRAFWKVQWEGGGFRGWGESLVDVERVLSPGSVDVGGYSGCHGEGLGCSVDERGGFSGRGRIQWMGKGSVNLSVCVCWGGGGGGFTGHPACQMVVIRHGVIYCTQKLKQASTHTRAEVGVTFREPVSLLDKN